jgi:F-type H+-transporting ATPase subunit b
MRGFIRLLGVAALIAVAGTGAASAANLPQLNSEYYPSQVIWLAVSFLVLYVIMWRVVLPRISHVLEERQDRIDGNLERAESIRREAQATAEAYEKTLLEARAAAQAVTAKARDKMAADAAAHHAKLGERLNAEIAEAEGRILAAKNEAMANLRDLAVEVTSTVAQRLVDESIDPRVVGKIVDGVIKERI